MNDLTGREVDLTMRMTFRLLCYGMGVSIRILERHNVPHSPNLKPHFYLGWESPGPSSCLQLHLLNKLLVGILALNLWRGLDVQVRLKYVIQKGSCMHGQPSLLDNTGWKDSHMDSLFEMCHSVEADHKQSGRADLLCLLP